MTTRARFFAPCEVLPYAHCHRTEDLAVYFGLWPREFSLWCSVSCPMLLACSSAHCHLIPSTECVCMCICMCIVPLDGWERA